MIFKIKANIFIFIIEKLSIKKCIVLILFQNWLLLYVIIKYFKLYFIKQINILYYYSVVYNEYSIFYFIDASI